MNKIDFTDIYKFLVSVGLAIIIFAIISPYLLFSNNFTFTLTQQEISEISSIGQEFLKYQQSYLFWIAGYYPYLAAVLFLVGSLLTSGGIWGWYKRQQMRNDREDAEARTAKREWEKIENKETREKLAQELKVYFSFENNPGKEVVQPVDFEYILAKYTGSRNSLIDLVRFSERYIQGHNYQILVDWKLEAFNYDVIIRPRSAAAGTDVSIKLKKRNCRMYAIKYAEHNPSIEWMQKVLAELWLSANAYRERNKINEVSATLIVLSPSAELSNTIKAFQETIPVYWQHQIELKIVGLSGKALEDLYTYHQIRNEKDLEYRENFFEMVFHAIDPEFVKEIESEQGRIDQSRSIRETKKDMITKSVLLVIGWSVGISVIVWVVITFVRFILLNKVLILNFISSILTPIGIALISIVLILLLAYQVRIRRNKVSGVLFFEDGSDRIVKFYLYSGKNYRVIGQRELRIYPELGLKKIIVHSVSGEPRLEEADRYDFNSMRIIVELINLKGHKRVTTLESDVPNYYSENNISMWYRDISS